MQIKKIIVDEIPESCGKCWLMRYSKNDFPFCSAIDDDHNEITGNPNDMKYRRSDCPLSKELGEMVFPLYRAGGLIPTDRKTATSIDDLGLSVRAYNCLKRHGVRTVDELKTMTDDELMQVRNLGSRCIKEIKEIIGGLE